MLKNYTTDGTAAQTGNLSSALAISLLDLALICSIILRRFSDFFLCLPILRSITSQFPVHGSGRRLKSKCLIWSLPAWRAGKGEMLTQKPELAAWVFKCLSNSSWWCGQSMSVHECVKEGAGGASGTPWK